MDVQIYLGQIAIYLAVIRTSRRTDRVGIALVHAVRISVQFEA